MAANSNFTLKLTLDEANDMRHALRERLDKIMATPMADLAEEQREEAGRIETMLRRDFG